MTHIPHAFIDELLTRIDIVSVIETYVQLKKAGKEYKSNCPFHQEKTPSFTVSQNKQFYHCFGCGAHGNAINFLMEYEHMSFVDAIETLASLAGLEIPKEASVFNEQNSTVELYPIMERSAHFYQAQLRKLPQAKNAIEYLKKRGLSKEIVNLFSIGYAPPGWDNLLHAIGTQPDERKQLLTNGMLVEKPENKSVYDRFRDRIMFPIRDRRGKVIAFGGRVLNDETPKYLNSPETPIFHKGNELYGLYEARKNNRQLNRLLLVEGYMDVVALAQNGITYAVATLGTSITNNHVQQLFKVCSEVVLCFDGDAAGRKAAWRSLEIILPIIRDGWQAKFVFLPDGEDPDTVVRKIGKDEFEKLIKNATSLSTFFFSHVSEQTDLHQIDGRAKLVSLAIPYIQKMTANIMREMMLEELARIAGMKVEQLNKHVPTQNQPGSLENLINTQATKTQQTPIRLAITLLIQNPKLAQEIIDDLPQTDLPGMALLRDLLSTIRETPNLTTGSLIERWRDKPEHPHLAKLASYEHLLADEAALLTEFRAILKTLHSQAITHEIEILETRHRTSGLSTDEASQLLELIKLTKSMQNYG